MKLFKEHKADFAIFTLLTILYFLSRFYRLETLPLFTDEAIYTRWSQIARDDAAWRFISLTDGKQPLFVWLDMNVMRFIKDPLLAGRMVSVIAGFFSMIGLFFLGKEVFKNSLVGIFSSILYLIYPFSLVYDRMALYDSLVGTFTVWSLYLEVLLIRRIRLDVTLILGMVIGAGVLTKTSAFFSIYLLPFSVILFDLSQKKKLLKFSKWVGLAGLATILAYGYYSILRLFPLFHIIEQKNAIFVYPFNEWIDHPFRFLMGNLAGMWDWYITYTTWPIVFLILLSLFIFWSRWKEKLLLVIWFVIPFFALALFGKVLYPRFIFFMTLPLLPLAALSLVKLSELFPKNKVILVLLLLGFFMLFLRSDYFILKDFSRAPIPESDLGQYINGWPAGGGLKEILSFLQEKASKQKIYVMSDGTFGSLPTYAVEIYLGANRNVDKRGVWPIPDELPKDLIEKAKAKPVYLIFNQAKIPSFWPAKLLLRYQKGISDSYISLHQVVSK